MVVAGYIDLKETLKIVKFPSLKGSKYNALVLLTYLVHVLESFLRS